MNTERLYNGVNLEQLELKLKQRDLLTNEELYIACLELNPSNLGFTNFNALLHNPVSTKDDSVNVLAAEFCFYNNSYQFDRLLQLEQKIITDSLYSNACRTQLALSHFYVFIRRIDLALPCLEKARLHSNNETMQEVDYAYALLYLLIENFEKARQHLNKISEKDYGYYRHDIELALHQKQGQYMDAQQLNDKLIQNGDTSITSQWRRLLFRYYLDPSIENLENLELYAGDNKDENLYIELAYLFAELNNTKKELLYLEKSYATWIDKETAIYMAHFAQRNPEYKMKIISKLDSEIRKFPSTSYIFYPCLILAKSDGTYNNFTQLFYTEQVAYPEYQTFATDLRFVFAVSNFTN